MYLIENEKLLSELNLEKNPNIDPAKITMGSEKKLIWTCAYNHDYECSVLNKKNGRGCPYCAGKKVLSGFNDLETRDPEKAKEWDYESNGGLLPSEIGPGSRKVVNWKCSKGHKYPQKVCDHVKAKECLICSNRIIVPGVNDLSKVYPDVAKEWDYEENRGVDIMTIAPSAKQVVHWICENGHKWEASVDSRTRRGVKRKCPVCTSQKLVKGINDLATENPEMLSQWDYELNTKTPDEFFSGSEEKVHWKCDMGHKWIASIGHVKRGEGCPICAGRTVLKGFNDLESQNPSLAKQWNYEKNRCLPSEVTYSSGKKIWWLCDRGHAWDATINSRNRGNGCPYCANKKVLPGYNDLATQNPNLADEWHQEKNGNLTAYEVTPYYSKKVWWRCKKNHEWNETVANRQQGRGCPICSNKIVLTGYNDLATKYPNLAKEWHDELNGNLKPTDVVYGSSKNVWWKCSKGHKWRTSIVKRTTGKTECPQCVANRMASIPEKAISYYLTKYFPDTLCNNREILKPLELDAYIPSIKVAVEYDGYFYHKSSKAEKRDERKNKMASEMGIKLYRIREHGLKHLDGCKCLIRDNNISAKDLDSQIRTLLDLLGVKNHDVDSARDDFEIRKLLNSDELGRRDVDNEILVRQGDVA